MHISSSYAKLLGDKLFHGRFPEVGQKQKTEKKRKKEEERLNDGNNNGQATHGARKPPGPTIGQVIKDLDNSHTLSRIIKDGVIDRSIPVNKKL